MCTLLALADAAALVLLLVHAAAWLPRSTWYGGCCDSLLSGWPSLACSAGQAAPVEVLVIAEGTVYESDAGGSSLCRWRYRTCMRRADPLGRRARGR